VTSSLATIILARSGARPSYRRPLEETMPAQIQRTSGPQPLREQADGEFTWTIPLSAIPSREWMKLFNTPLEPNEVFMPSRVDFRDRGLVFASREERITEWLKHIDQWIATANEGVAEAAERGSHEREREQRGVDEARQRIFDADKYRNL
jgi:hypothetical protein